ncbi:hypothetical protein ACSL103130_05175 [Actinomyces slackii]|uniref:Orc1-like AAA ATPase domain-containing protein n=1 Tax=Actinomyces slackii TaxID=52774 RepID=A0A3S4U3Q2_9ACTO|nr:hypothetical protein [Actinomyces slackii]VEG75749.1 Uncharacterised protein [Actinomyces slackii]
MADTDREYRKAFYRAVNLHQGAQLVSGQEEYEQCYVPIYDQPDGPAGPDLVREIATAIDFTTGGSVQLLSGYRGAGKTTELLRLCRELDAEAYVPVYLNIEDYFNPELPLDSGSFLIGLAAGFVANCEGAGIPKQKLAERMEGLLERLKLTVDASAAFNPGSVSLDIRAALREDETFRAQVRQALESNRRTFRQEVHEFFSAVVGEMPGGRVPVFVVDSIDHFRGRAAPFDEVRDSVESLFSVHASELSLPGMHVVYTVPIYAKPVGWDSPIWPVLNVKVRERNGSDCREGIDLLREVLVKRAPGGDLERLLGTEVDRVIRSSGGQFRELFRLVSALLLKDGALPVSAQEVDQVERQMRSQAAVALSREQWEILRQVKEAQQLSVPRAQVPEARALQALGYVLCYRNGEVDWYGVHPLVETLLDERV